jgi:hypothetical protein
MLSFIGMKAWSKTFIILTLAIEICYASECRIVIPQFLLVNPSVPSTLTIISDCSGSRASVRMLESSLSTSEAEYYDEMSSFS